MRLLPTARAIGLCLLTLHAHGQEAAYVPGNILVMLREGASPERLAEDLGDLNGTTTALRVEYEVSAPMRVWLLQFDATALHQNVMLRAVRAHAAVLFAQNDHLIEERDLPNDPQFGDQWHHTNINSAAAWDITTGGLTATGDTIVVCIIERADLAQPDLIANAWTNAQEIAGNGIDDDGNGYIDDVRGWNAPAGNDDVYGSTHGTQVAGMIGAVGNNALGVVGANWNVRMMPVGYGNTQESSVIAAYTYPLVMRKRYNASNGQTGAFVVVTNASWGINGGQPADAPLWCAMYDSLGAAGVLSCGATANNQVDVDVVGDLPTACPSPYLISVTATNNLDQRTFSAFGATTIDVGAPGAAVITTLLNGNYGSANGTSFASPLTAGVVGLLYSAPCPALMALAQVDPAAAALHVREVLFGGVDHVGNLPGTIVTGGRINAGTSMQLMMDACGPCPPPFNVIMGFVGSDIANVFWTPQADATEYVVQWREQGAIVWNTIGPIVDTFTEVPDLSPCRNYEVQVASVCFGMNSPWSPSVDFITLECSPCTQLPYCASSGQSTADAWIESVDINGFISPTGNDGGYGSFIGGPFTITNVDNGLTLVPGFASLPSQQHWSIWVDADQSGTFENQELVFQTTIASSTDVFADFDLPNTLIWGITRMRIVMSSSGPISDPCAEYPLGETEDYCADVMMAWGIEDHARDNSIAASPNPASDLMTLTSQDHFRNGRMGVTIADATGRSVQRTPWSGLRCELDVSALAEGAYTYSVVGNSQPFATGRFMVVR